MRNKLALSIALVASLQASLVSALSLGDLTVESKVNEPLNAVIELTGASHLSASQILVQMAGPEDFRRANVERPFFLTGISFNVEKNSRGEPVLRLTSSEKITEPYVNFILETRWPNGRVMREYLALLDLPIHSSAQGRGVDIAPQTKPYAANTAVQSPSRSANQPSASNRTSTTGVNSGSAPSASALSGYGGGTESYTVKSNDTAWEIAERFTPSGARVEQTLYALYDQNTGAFANGDVNRLNNGAVLRVPDAEDVAAISPTQAKNWQREQHANWKARTATAKTGQALDGARKTRQASAPSKDSNGHLTLTSQSGVEQHLSQAEKTLQESNQAGAGAGPSGELVAALEKLDRTQLEKNALDERYASLQQRFAQLEKLVTLKNAQLAELTASVEKSDQILTELEANSASGSSAEGADSVIGAQNTAADAESLIATTGASATGDNATETAKELDAVSALEAAEHVAAVEISAAEKTTLSTEVVTAPVSTATDQTVNGVDNTPAIVKASGTLDTLTTKLSGITALLPAVIKDNLIAFGGAVSGLLLAIAGFLVVRARRAGAEEASDLALETPVWADTDFVNEEDLLENAETAEVENEEVGFGLPQASLEGEEGLELVEEGVSEVGGLLAEVDIYLSYGRHEQAIESLQQLIAENESNTELHLKLIEVYRAKGDQLQAQETAETLLKFDPSAQPQVNDLLNDVGVSSELAETQALDSSVLNSEVLDSEVLDGVAIGDNEGSDLDLSLDLHDTLGESSSESANNDLAALDEEDFSAAFESSDDAGDLLDLSEDTIESGAIETDALELGALDFDTFDESSVELPTADVTSNELDVELDDLATLGELDSLETDSLDGGLDLDASLDTLSSLDGVEAESSIDSLEVSLDLEETSLELDDVSLDLNGLDDEDSISLEADVALDSDNAEASHDSEPGDVLETAERDSAADGSALDSEIAAAYGDLDIDLSATRAETEDAPETSFGNPSVEEVLGTDDIPTLEMSDTYVADDKLSESLGLQAEGESDAESGLEGDAEASSVEISAITDDDLEAEYQSAAALLEQSNEESTGLESSASEASDEAVLAEVALDSDADSDDTESLAANAEDDEFGDEIATKLDLARAYLEMGDIDGAKDVLDEVASEGDKRQQQEAAALLQKIA